MGAGAALCLVTGATGYIGGRLVPELLAAGHRVRVMSRDPRRLARHPWAEQVEIVEADAADADAVRAALSGADVAFYLIHALTAGRDFEARDRQMAATFAAAAREAQVARLVYLGGLLPVGETPSPHLRSRAEVGRIMLASGVPSAVLQAAVIIGSGSASFEMLRYLTERLPVMVCPKWVRNRTQPIAIRDVLHYLVGCVGLPREVSRAFDIGGPDVLTYEQMMQRYAAATGLRRRIVAPINVLTPSLSSHWVGVVTPVPRSIARPLVESLRNTVVCTEHDIAAYVPDPPAGLLGFEPAVSLALARTRRADVSTRWSSASGVGAPSGQPSDPLSTDPEWTGGSRYVDERRREVAAPAQTLWEVIEGIGGERGWYSFPLAWQVRGWLDRLSGGPGLRRGRRDPDAVYVGEALDFWRVEEADEPRLLRLRAEMRLPGRAWLELAVTGGAEGRVVYLQRAIFHPHGLAGQLYWLAITPFHGAVFGGMSRNIARAAEKRAREGASHPL